MLNPNAKTHRYDPEYYRANIERFKKNQRKYYSTHTEEIKRKNKLYAQTSEKYKTFRKKYEAKWRRKNKDKFSEYYQKRKRALLLSRAASAQHCLLSIVGAHAGEELDGILTRKKEDIKRCGKTFWVVNSSDARAKDIQNFHGCIYVLFLAPLTENGARPTTAAEETSMFSEDGISWNKMPSAMSKVTGRLISTTCALVLDTIEKVDGTKEVPLAYVDLEDKPIRFRLGCSTMRGIKKDIQGAKMRRVIAVGKLIAPWGVHLR